MRAVRAAPCACRLDGCWWCSHLCQLHMSTRKCVISRAHCSAHTAFDLFTRPCASRSPTPDMVPDMSAALTTALLKMPPCMRNGTMCARGTGKSSHGELCLHQAKAVTTLLVSAGGYDSCHLVGSVSQAGPFACIPLSPYPPKSLASCLHRWMRPHNGKTYAGSWIQRA